MKKEQVLDLMNAVPADLVEEAGVERPVKRRLSRVIRTGLIAVCLCLALLGTAFAAAPEAMAALIERLSVSTVSNEDHSGYTIQGDMVQYPLSAFSPALLAASEGRESPAAPVSLTFDTWDEVQAFLGGNIPCVWPGGGAGWDTDHFQVVLFHTELEVLWGVHIYSVDLTRQAVISVNIYTEHWPHRNDDIAGLLDAPGTSIEQLGSYPMASGAAAEIVVLSETDETEYIPQCGAHGFFMSSGILYQVETLGSVPSREETVSRLYAILDSFS